MFENGESPNIDSVKIPSSIELIDHPNSIDLVKEDQEWLSSFGVNPDWQNDADKLELLRDAIRNGSLHLDKSISHDSYNTILGARLYFIEFVGISKKVIKDFQTTNPNIIPLDTFIKTQRVLYSLGLDNKKIINVAPRIIGLSSESIQEKITNLATLGLDPIKIVNAVPTILHYTPESIQEKITNLATLGLDPIKIVNMLPTILHYTHESIQEKMTNLATLGLDPIKIVNMTPAVIHYTSESMQAKINNLTSLGLDPKEIITTFPNVLCLSPKSVEKKVKFIQQSAKLLQWQYSAVDLIKVYPNVLAFNPQKLAILRRIAAHRLTSEAKSCNPSILSSKLTIPIEKYIIALANTNNKQSLSLSELSKMALKVTLDTADRKEKAIQYSTKTQDRIAKMYLKYAIDKPPKSNTNTDN